MKKGYYLILISMVLFILMSCTGYNTDIGNLGAEAPEPSMIGYESKLEGVWFETEYQMYSSNTTNIKVKWYNTIKDEVMFGEYYTLEEYVDDEWVQVVKDSDTNYGFTDIGYTLHHNQTRWHNYDLVAYVDELNDGYYRIKTSVHRMTNDGKDYGPGNYPSYDLQAYFEVGAQMVEREIHPLRNDRYEYKNDQIGFVIDLPEAWEGLTTIEEGHNLESQLHELLFRVDSNYSILRIRHPEWTQEEPYQDIVITVLNADQWNAKIWEAVSGKTSDIPIIILGTYKYVLLYDPHYYRVPLKGLHEVKVILNGGIETY